MSDYLHSEARKESMKAARSKYDKVNTRFYGIKLNIGTDFPIISALDQASNKTDLIRKAMQLYITVLKNQPESIPLILADYQAALQDIADFRE